MRVHAEENGAVLCGQANARSVPLWVFIKVKLKVHCKRCRKLADDIERRQPSPNGTGGQ